MTSRRYSLVAAVIFAIMAVLQLARGILERQRRDLGKVIGDNSFDKLAVQYTTVDREHALKPRDRSALTEAERAPACTLVIFGATGI
jgi:hypothetical protein